MTRRQLTGIVAAVATIALVVLSRFLPVPYIVESPGPVFDTLGSVGSTTVVSIKGATTYPTSGHIYLLTVYDTPGDCSSHPSLFHTVKAWFSKDDAVVPEQAICQPNETTGTVVVQDETDMAQSQISAETAALTTLGYKVIGHQVVVEAVDPDAPAYDKLLPDDIINSVNGVKISGPDQLVKAIDSKPVGTSFAVDYTRSGKPGETTIKSAPAPETNGTTDVNKGYLGVTISPHPLFNGVSVNIGINPDQVGGPSAGTALALGIIDKLTDGGITHGRTIAGTGTINAAGKIGEIGGIQQKVAAAVNNHATVFFSPAGNCSDAKSVAPKSLTLIKAETLSEVLAAIKDINAGSSDFPHC